MKNSDYLSLQSKSLKSLVPVTFQRKSHKETVEISCSIEGNPNCTLLCNDNLKNNEKFRAIANM